VNANASTARGDDARVKADITIAIDTNLLLVIDLDVEEDVDVWLLLLLELLLLQWISVLISLLIAEFACVKQLFVLGLCILL